MKLTDTRADVLRLIAEGKHIGHYMPRYDPKKHRGRGALPVTIAERAATWLMKHGLVHGVETQTGGYRVEPTEAGLAELYAIDERLANRAASDPDRIGRREARRIVESARPGSCRLISTMLLSHRDIMERRDVEERREAQCTVEELRNEFEQHPRAELTRHSDGVYNLHIGTTWGYLNYRFET